jgi:agmatine deiminase
MEDAMPRLTPTPHSPAALNYRMPAEWEPHVATWLSWPRREATWPGNFAPIPAVWAELARTLAKHEQVHILAGGAEIMAQARALVGEVAGVTLHDVLTNDGWMRDHGPMFLVGPAGARPTLVDWEYNAWGCKYPPFDADNRVPQFVADYTHYRRIAPGIVLEGGAVDVNGVGSMLTTEQCLLNDNRNPGLSRDEIEQFLCDYAAAVNVIWLGEGIVGDDTDGHIDELARFVGPRTIVAAVERDPTDVNYAALQDNLQRLTSAHDEQGRPFEVIPLPLPGPIVFQDQRLPASYCNFYLANDIVIVPQFDDPADRVAVETLAKCFPERTVIGLRARELVWGLGAFHCITQQQPRQD